MKTPIRQCNDHLAQAWAAAKAAGNLPLARSIERLWEFAANGEGFHRAEDDDADEQPTRAA